jgi:hypothetical protein
MNTPPDTIHPSTNAVTSSTDQPSFPFTARADGAGRQAPAMVARNAAKIRKYTEYHELEY